MTSNGSGHRFVQVSVFTQEARPEWGGPPRSRVSVTVRREGRQIRAQEQISRPFPWPLLVEVRIYLVIDPDMVDRTVAGAGSHQDRGQLLDVEAAAGSLFDAETPVCWIDSGDPLARTDGLQDDVVIGAHRSVSPLPDIGSHTHGVQLGAVGAVGGGHAVAGSCSITACAPNRVRSTSTPTGSTCSFRRRQ